MKIDQHHSIDHSIDGNEGNTLQTSDIFHPSRGCYKMIALLQIEICSLLHTPSISDERKIAKQREKCTWLITGYCVFGAKIAEQKTTTCVSPCIKITSSSCSYIFDINKNDLFVVTIRRGNTSVCLIMLVDLQVSCATKDAARGTAHSGMDAIT